MVPRNNIQYKPSSYCGTESDTYAILLGRQGEKLTNLKKTVTAQAAA